MIFNKKTAQKTAELLLHIKAIKLNPLEPFEWASGWKSPIYCDNRLILSYPHIRNYIKNELANNIEKLYGKPDVIAGVATGAIGIGSLVADELGLPFVYVRPEPKKHGRQNQIEGQLEKGQNTVIIEDLISSGKSSLNVVNALRNESIKIKGMVSIFTYGFEISKSKFLKNNIELRTLSNYSYLLEQALDTGYINESELKILSKWNKNPSKWNIKLNHES